MPLLSYVYNSVGRATEGGGGDIIGLNHQHPGVEALVRDVLVPIHISANPLYGGSMKHYAPYH